MDRINSGFSRQIGPALIVKVTNAVINRPNSLPAVPPQIDRTNLKLTKVRVGKSVHLDVDVLGEPAPDVKWYFEGKEVFGGKDNYNVENVPHNTKFDIERGKRKQSGKYKIVATNEHGEDQEYVEIVFLGPPSSPMGKSHGQGRNV